MGVSLSSEKAVKKLMAENVIGMKHIEEAWAKYSKGQPTMSHTRASKFLKQLGAELRFEMSDALVGDVILLCDPQRTEQISLETFVQLFLEVRGQIRAEGTREIKVTHSVLFTGEMQKAILQAQSSLNSPPGGTEVFGRPLEEAAARNRDCPLVPAPLMCSFRWLEAAKIGPARAIDEEGLYRVPGSAAKFAKYKQLFDSGVIVDYFKLDERHPENVTLVVIHYLKGLPAAAGLVPSHCSAELVEAMEALRSDLSNAALSSAVEQLLAAMPAANRATLAFIALHFQEVARNAERNKMSLANIERTLGICLGPTVGRAVATLLHCPALLDSLGSSLSSSSTPSNNSETLPSSSSSSSPSPSPSSSSSSQASTSTSTPFFENTAPTPTKWRQRSPSIITRTSPHLLATVSYDRSAEPQQSDDPSASEQQQQPLAMPSDEHQYHRLDVPSNKPHQEQPQIYDLSTDTQPIVVEITIPPVAVRSNSSRRSVALHRILAP